MDITSSLLDIINEPTIVFGDQDQFLSNYVASSLPASWDLSPLNPKNRIESLDNSNCKWRIDGCARFGTQFHAIPTHVPDLVPIRIDVFIPSQDHHPFELRDTLDSSYSLFVKGAEVANMGIAKHVCRALDYHSERDPEFWKIYQNLPFGSRILIESHPAISIETTNENVGWTGKPTWLALETCEQENAEVYNLGLFLYCVFEGQCSVQKSLLSQWPYNPTIDFPEFRRTPEKLREIIRRCAIDSPEWNREPEHKGGRYGGVVRRRGKVYPRRQYADYDVRKEIWDSARRWWEEELWMMETFLKDSSPSQEREIRRPTLGEVLAFLESAEEIERLA